MSYITGTNKAHTLENNAKTKTAWNNFICDWNKRLNDLRSWLCFAVCSEINGRLSTDHFIIDNFNLRMQLRAGKRWSWRRQQQRVQEKRAGKHSTDNLVERWRQQSGNGGKRWGGSAGSRLSSVGFKWRGRTALIAGCTEGSRGV